MKPHVAEGWALRGPSGGFVVQGYADRARVVWLFGTRQDARRWRGSLEKIHAPLKFAVIKVAYSVRIKA